MTTITLPDEMPSRMRQLRRDEVGRPVPFFAAEVDGKHDFRLMDAEALITAIKDELCFVCGQRLNRSRYTTGPRGTFVVGPMCVVNRISAEPPNHADCARWSARACPFLTKPLKERRDSNLPEGVTAGEAAGFMIERNPGVTALVSSERWRVFEAPMGGHGLLFQFHIEHVNFMTAGRESTIEEVLWSMETGLPALMNMAREDGGMQSLGRKVRTALRLFPHGNVEEYPNLTEALAAA